MAGDPQKIPLVQSLSQFVSQKVADVAAARGGQALPCHVTDIVGQIVTVAFDVQGNNVTLPPVTIPIATSIYDWLPIQVGDKGLAVPASVYLGGASGLGGGTAGYSFPANLTALVFVPISNVAWTVTDDKQRVVQGPHGVVLQDLEGHTILTINNSGTITLKASAVVIDTLPTSPGTTGELWNSSGTVKVS